MEKTEDFTEFQDPSSASVDRLVQSLDRAYHRPGLLMWRSFLSGLMYAIGATVGLTLLLTIAAYVLQALGGINLINPLIQKLDDNVVSIENRSNQSTTLTPAEEKILSQLNQSPTPTPTR